MRTNLKSKAGLALVAAAAIGMCVPAYAAPGNHGAHAYGRGAPPAQRHHHHHRNSGNGVGLVLGIAAIGAAIVASRAYSQPAPLYYAPAQTIYVEPPPPAVQPALPSAAQNYWYYCRELDTYYPYAQQCPGQWQPVIPQPPAPGR
ncbi:MAG: hypothetical protein EXR31_06675 [Betaproteobacteria bacterium]|nr:hypothetical protein [Betaproteobacteria bacterium]